jgi:DNA-binding CsgD family transcriptional regulator
MDRDPGEGDLRLLRTLEGLLALEVSDLETAMTRAADALARVLGADKVDVFLHEPAGRALVAVGTSETPMGREEHALGLDRLPIAGGGTTVGVFETGRGFLTGHLDREPGELRGVVDGLGVRSAMGTALEVAGERRGVLLACSAEPEFFSERDLAFLGAVSRWIGLAGARAVEVERLAGRAAEAGLRRGAEEVLDALTPRQREVAGLVADGLSNAEIAERLVLTPGTVANHVEAILGRLGLRSRTQIGVWAAERGLRAGGAANGRLA